jgi:acyl-CoA thioesterase I
MRLILLALLLIGMTEPSRAEVPCVVPDDLAMHDLALPAAKQAVATTRKLVILALGGSQTAGAPVADPAASYPARLQADLTDTLPGVTVSVVNAGRADNSVEAVVPGIAAQIAAAGAKLVIWGPGGRDAMSRPDLDGFFVRLEMGIANTRKAGADLILLDLPYVPALEQWSRIEDYRDLLRGTALANDVPLLPRHELMRAWADDGLLNLDATEQSEQTASARRLFACMAHALATPIGEAVR